MCETRPRRQNERDHDTTQGLNPISGSVFNASKDLVMSATAAWRFTHHHAQRALHQILLPILQPTLHLRNGTCETTPAGTMRGKSTHGGSANGALTRADFRAKPYKAPLQC